MWLGQRGAAHPVPSGWLLKLQQRLPVHVGRTCAPAALGLSSFYLLFFLQCLLCRETGGEKCTACLTDFTGLCKTCAAGWTVDSSEPCHCGLLIVLTSGVAGQLLKSASSALALLDAGEYAPPSKQTSAPLCALPPASATGKCVSCSTGKQSRGAGGCGRIVALVGLHWADVWAEHQEPKRLGLRERLAKSAPNPQTLLPPKCGCSMPLFHAFHAGCLACDSADLTKCTKCGKGLYVDAGETLRCAMLCCAVQVVLLCCPCSQYWGAGEWRAVSKQS